jgi:hypothetical protein
MSMEIRVLAKHGKGVREIARELGLSNNVQHNPMQIVGCIMRAYLILCGNLPNNCRVLAQRDGGRRGFEPSIRFPVYTLSRRAPSTTLPPLRLRESPQ